MMRRIKVIATYINADYSIIDGIYSVPGDKLSWKVWWSLIRSHHRGCKFDIETEMEVN